MPKKDDVFFWMPLGDIHWGSPAHDRAKFIKDLEWVRDDPFRFTIGMGDFFENNSLEGRAGGLNKHFDQENLIASSAPFLENEIEQFIPVWKQLMKRTKTFPQSKCVGMLMGNHEDRTLKHIGFDTRVCRPLEAENLGDLAFIELLFKHDNKPVNSYTAIAAHGRFGGQKLGTVLSAAHNKFEAYEFDIAMFGHTHFAGVEKYHKGGIETAGEAPCYVEQKRFIVNTGAFVKSHVEDLDLYTDKMFGSLRNKGTVTIEFLPEKKEISVIV